MKPNSSKRLLTGLLCLLTMSLFAPEALVAQEAATQKQEREKDFLSTIFKDDPAYVFAYFMGSGDGLHLMYSYDGLLWKPLNNGNVLLKPEVGTAKLFRDPSIVKDHKGVYHMVWTTGWTENNIGYANSTDLIHWSEQRELPVMAHEPEVRNTWAPELYFHKATRTFYIFWSSTIPGRFPETGKSEIEYNHRMYYTTTKDFKTFTPTKLFYDPNFCVIDGFVIKEKGWYYLFVKNETLEPVEKNIRVTRSRRLTKFPAEVSEPLTGREWAEGPAVIKIGKFTYLYWDKYRNHRYGAMRCKSLKKGDWEDISDRIKFPPGVRHGTAVKVSAEILHGLQQLSEE